MSEESMTQFEAITALDLYGTAEGMDDTLSALRKAVLAVPVDITTVKGRDLVKSNAHSVSRFKVAFDNMGKELTADKKAEIKAVDAERKRLRDTLDALKIEVRQPVTEFEEAEKVRVANIKEMIRELSTGYGAASSVHHGTVTLQQLREAATAVSDTEVTEEIFGEFMSEALVAQYQITNTLKAAIEQAEAGERQRLELEKMKAEQVAREQEERDERIRREAVEAERKAAELQAAKAKADAERMERINRENLEAVERESERREAAEKAKDEAKAREAEQQVALAQEREKRALLEAETAALRERERIEAGARAVKAEEERRAKDEEWRHVVIAGADCYLRGKPHNLDVEQAERLANSIADGDMPNVTMTF